jgi:hypothetical protein
MQQNFIGIDDRALWVVDSDDQRQLYDGEALDALFFVPVQDEIPDLGRCVDAVTAEVHENQAVDAVAANLYILKLVVNYILPVRLFDNYFGNQVRIDLASQLNHFVLRDA